MPCFPPGQPQSLIFEHIRAKDVDAVKGCIDRGQNLEVLSHRQWTPLMQAAHLGLTDIVNVLIEAGADIEACDPRNKENAFSLATEGGYIEVMDVLLKAGADIEHRIDQGETSLWVATYWNEAETVQWLIEHGAKLDAQKESGETALFMAVDNKDEAIIDLLLAAGARLDITNNQGQTPIDTAVADDNLELATRLTRVAEQRENQKRMDQEQARKNKQTQLRRYRRGHRGF